MVFHLNDIQRHFLIFCLFFLNACTPQPPLPSPAHLNTDNIPPPKDDIPPLIQQKPFVPPPLPTPPLSTFTVAVESVPVDKLLFALARDAGLNVDIHPNITGTVTLNAVKQTLPQLLERIAKQVDLRYQIEGRGTHLTISPDLPYMRLYKIGYVNLSRKSSGEVSIATEIAQTGGGISSSNAESGGNISTTKITNESNNRFWETLKKNIIAILTSTSSETTSKEEIIQDKVIINPESGMMTIRATQRQHEEIQSFVDQLLANVQRQVLIEATIAEVRLSDQYQAGIDWQRIVGHYSYTQSLTGANLKNPPVFSMKYTEPDSRFGNLSATVRILEQFGTVKVLSSPKIMALNNQTAIIKVVDNIVYFTTEVEINETETKTRETFTTEINTVPVGLVMSVTPQISENGIVILNIRPTISHIINFKQDPNPALAEAGMVNLIPEIQVREIETVLKINNGEIGIIGGLMQDVTNQNTQGVPVLSKLPLIGELFSYRDNKYTKTELVIFLRPVVVKDASLSGDLHEYQVYLPTP
ncbi:MAG: pilus (MSHA type) biogenesis protein MshL [Pseudomonadota bacterium]